MELALCAGPYGKIKQVEHLLSHSPEQKTLTVFMPIAMMEQSKMVLQPPCGTTESAHDIASGSATMPQICTVLQ